jgi:hypothetical protein
VFNPLFRMKKWGFAYFTPFWWCFILKFIISWLLRIYRLDTLSH